MTTEPEQWTASKVECDLCTTQWVAVWEVNTPRLECPNCSNMVTITIIEDDNNNNDSSSIEL